jgi:branched-chain amino acid aminotransferase
MRSDNCAYVNGRFVPEKEATVSVFDRGFLYGDGVFETMRVYDGRIFRLLEHVTRLVVGIGILGIDIEETQAHLEGVCEEIVLRNRIVNGMVRIYLTRGMSNIGLSGTRLGRPTIVAVSQEREFGEQGSPLRVIIASERIDAESLLTRVKSANRLPYVLAKYEAQRFLADDAILLNRADHVVELTASNLFAYREGRLLTPRLHDGALPGITRAVVLMLAPQVGIDVEEASITPDEMRLADEIFATNSLFEISPVAMFADLKLNARRITGRLQEALQEYIREELRLPQ